METKNNIKRFFLQQCNAEEAANMAAYLDENPGVLDEYISEREWENFQETGRLSQSVSGSLWKNVQARRSNKKRVPYYIKRVAVAASVMLAVTLSWYLAKKPTKTTGTEIAVNKERLPALKTTVNNGVSKYTFFLNDGSKIQLLSGSSLTYPDTFITDKRVVILSGEAVFYVAKNREKPFTVYSGAISTTALGTVFRIKSYDKSRNVEVKLLEGRIVIKPVRARSPFKDIYLKPGETVVYNKATETGTVTAQSAKKDEVQAGAKNISQVGPEKNNSYIFDNEQLFAVFERISAIYTIKINYDKTELEEMTFTAQLKKTDSPENVLKSIALLNDLKLEKTREGYRIHKK